MSDAIEKVYKKYKHLDEMLSRDNEPANFNARIIYDLWQAIKAAQDYNDACDSCDHQQFIWQQHPHGELLCIPAPVFGKDIKKRKELHLDNLPFEGVAV